jgi:cysteine peptidase C11 family protein
MEKRPPHTKRNPPDMQIPPTKEWTVMLYMVASRDSYTEELAYNDIDEMMRVDSIKDLNVLIHLDRAGRQPAQRILVHPGGKLSDDLPAPTNSGDPKVLEAFLNWCHGSFPAKHYLLVLWGHSMGLEFGEDHGDPLTIQELSTVLDGAPFKLDILGCNACHMASAEGLYELRNSARYVVAWENIVPYKGWPYSKILNEMSAAPDMTPKDLGLAILNESDDTRVKLTMFDLSLAESLGDKVKNLAFELTAATATELKGILKAFATATETDFPPLIDLVDLCNKLKQYAGGTSAALSSAADRIVEFLKPREDGFILKNAASKLNGLGIFAPSRAATPDSAKDMLKREKPYKKLRLMTEQMEEQKTSWADFVYKLMNRVLNSDSDHEVVGKGPQKR